MTNTTYEVKMERGDGWDAKGNLIRKTIVRVTNVDDLKDALHFFYMLSGGFESGYRSTVRSGDWKMADGRRIVKSFSADVIVGRNGDGWPDATDKTSVTVAVIETTTKTCETCGAVIDDPTRLDYCSLRCEMGEL